MIDSAFVTCPSKLSDHTFLLIPEVAQAHCGSYTLACAYIDLVHSLDLPLIKFQHHISNFESSPSEQFRFLDKRIISKSRFAYWEDYSFDIDTWARVVEYASSKNVSVIFTPNSRQSAQLLDSNFDVPFWKVGSSDISNFHLLDFLFDTNKQVIISTGLASLSSVEALSRFNIDQLSLLSCISTYPSPLEQFSLDRLRSLRKYVNSDFSVGLSDHSGSTSPSLLALSSGFRIIEFHLTLSDLIFNFDLSSSLSIQQVSSLVQYVRELSVISRSLSAPSSIDVTNTSIQSKFNKSIFSSRALTKGAVLMPDDLCMIRSTDGVIPQSDYYSVVGQILDVDLSPFSPISYSFLR